MKLNGWDGLGTLRRLLQEAGRRHVARVAVVYAAVAFAVLEAADIVIPVLGWPPWAIRWVIGLALLGFPIALILAWVFDFTPKGVVRTKALEDVGLEEASRPEGPRPIVSAVLLLFSGALVAMGAFFTFQWSRTEESVPAGLIGPGELSMRPQRIAVLPFVDLDGAEDGGFFANGIHEDILNHLAKIDSLEVISRTTMLQYRNTEKTSQQIGQELNAGSILEGSVRHQGDRIRVVAQLIDSRSEAHLWSETYDTLDTDVFGVQSQIAQDIAGALEVELTTEEIAQLAAPGAVSGEAYAVYARGLWEWDLRGNRGNAFEAARLFRRATEIDSTFATAYSALSQAHMWLFWNFPGARDHAERGTEALDRAVALAPDAVETRLAQGYFHYYGTGNTEAALGYFNQALEIRPRDAEVHTAIGMILRGQGRWEEAVSSFQQAQVYEARSYNLIYTLGDTFFRMRRWEEAARMLEAASTLAPDAVPPHRNLLRLRMATTGELASARDYVQGLPATVPAHVIARLEADLAYYEGDFQSALSSGSRRGEPGEGPGRPAAGELEDPAPPADARLDSGRAPGSAMGSGGRPPQIPGMATLGEDLERKALLYHLLGDEEASQANADSLRAGSQAILDELEANPGPFQSGVTAVANAKLGLAYAILGEPFQAIARGSEAVNIQSLRHDAYVGGEHVKDLIITYLLIGAVDMAVEDLRDALAVPSPITQVELLFDPLFAPLRDHPEFQTLLSTIQ
jgi:TolB-like protein/Tfp pilus assembly protein PilF